MDYPDGSDVITGVLMSGRQEIRGTEGNVVTKAERDLKMLHGWP